MFNEERPGYEQFYIRAIKNHPAGLKLAPGGTGLGKTSAIKKVTRYPDFSQKKSIYMANLKQLVEDVGRDENSLILHSDRDTVFFTLRDHRQAFYELFQDETHFRVPILQWNQRHRNMKVDLAKVKRACQAFEEILADHTSIPSSVEEQMSDYARSIMHCFQAAVQGVKTKRGNNSTYQFLLDHPIIQSLFPFIAFKRRPEIRLIAMTIQKAYYGFFDGSRKLNLLSLTDDNGGYILFLDEFDYLEPTLVHLICESAQITNPFHFVQLFFHAMEEHKLPYSPYPSSQELRDKLIDIRQVIKDLQEETHLRYPTIYQFTKGSVGSDCHSAKGRSSSQVIFRTQHIVRTDFQYIRQTSRSFELSSDPIAEEEDLEDEEEERRASSALRLFSAVSQASDLIIQFFRELRFSNDELVYQEIMHHCYQDTIYPEEMERITQYVVPHEPEDGTELGELLERGYSLYDTHDPQQITDAEEVEVHHYGMHVTPEVILRSLTLNNLVFGLSATADIPRFVHHFHMDWMRQHMEVHKATPEDMELIRRLNQQKAEQRDNHISLHLVPELNAADDDQHQIVRYIRQVSIDEEFGADPTGYRKRRVELFFSVLLHLCQSPAQDQENNSFSGPDTTLLFLNSFRQIRVLFERYPQPESGIFSIRERSHSKDFDVFEVTIKDRTFLVAFYNARQGNKMRQLAHVQQEFDQLFWEGKPVIVVTQYKSAGIGINLQYWASPEKQLRQDFKRIGLLEAPYFYFGNPLDEDLTEPERITCLKENIWYLGKLYSGKLISPAQFRQMLTTLQASSNWNTSYHKHTRTMYDAHLNSITAFIQAFGRIERIWEKMPDQQVLTSREVYQHLQRFCFPEFEPLRAEREAFVSSNLRQILQQVSAALTPRQREVRQLKDSRLVNHNANCRRAIEPLLARLEKIRQGNPDPEASQIWQHMRQAVLKHNYDDPVLRRYACVAESSYYQQGMLLLTPEDEILPQHIILADTFLWDMNRLYRVIKDNHIIRDYFQAHGYRLAFPPAGKQFLTPYCFQAILKGAIGEEAITALLLEEGFALEELPHILTEVADLKIAQHPYYFDCKFYNEYTLGRFSLPKDDPEWHIKLNDDAFRASACRKVARLQAQHTAPVKLIYLNLVTAQPRTLGYYNLDFQEVSFANASIIVVQGILQGVRPNVYHTAFEHFLRDISKVVPLRENLTVPVVAEQKQKEQENA